MRWGEGHIHETYLVKTKGHNPDYILQKINHNIFRNIPGMMSNIEKITSHLTKKLTGIQCHDPGTGTMTLVLTKTGETHYYHQDGNCWRMFVFIPGTVTYQNLIKPHLASEAGRIISSFQALLADLPDTLIDTIPDFHNINLRISQYEDARLINPEGRASRVQEDIDFVEQRLNLMIDYFRLLQENAITRPTHNDTKLNNILFDKNDRAVCVIDLDTVMPGFVHFDYGDALRTMANTAEEDEKDLLKVHFNRDIYTSYTRGYLENASHFLSPNELELLPYAPVYMTFLIGLRFLTDHLNGDKYYRINHPGHNLERAKVQFRLAVEMEEVLSITK
jgi:Ser/Thr protein kinase RdoA (MazF antagonist)